MSLSISRITKPYWWTIPEAERERIASAVPDGMTLVLYPGYRAKPGTTTVSLRDERNTMLQETRGSNLAHMCWYVINREREARGVEWACFLCHADISHGDYVRVGWPDGSVRDVCDTCVSRADDSEPLEEYLDARGALS